MFRLECNRLSGPSDAGLRPCVTPMLTGAASFPESLTPVMC